MTHILIPREPSPALLRPFVGCPQEELPQAYAAMIRIAEVERARAGSQCLQQIEEPAGAAPAAVAPQGVVAWMHPETLNVISAAHKHDMSTEYGAETRRKAESYSVALVRAGEPAAAAPALEAPAAPLDDSELEDLAYSANQECLSFGMSLDPFLRLAKTVRDRMLAAPSAAPAAPGMAVTALAGEIIAALEADEKDGGYDLTSGLFGPKFSALVRRWAASEWAHITAPQAPAAPVLVGDGQADAYLADPGRLETLARSHPAGLVRALARAAMAAPAAPAEGEVLVEVIGLTGSGKSAICGEIEILCRALGLDVSWPDGDPEKNMTHAEWTAAIEAYKPRVRIVERNVPRQSNGGPAK